MSSYRPGQLYEGADGDLLFVIFSGGDIEFVTLRGTRISVTEAERVYAPLTLVYDGTRTEVQQLRAELADLREGESTVTEYGVKAWSKYHGTQYVDPCDDLKSALSTLWTKRRLVDGNAVLVFRQVTARRSVGEWRAVSRHRAAGSPETEKAA